jgi:serine/threonine protein kinase
LGKIASGAAIGPALNKLCGFDIVLYRNCMEFSMEKCKDAVTVLEDMREATLILKRKLHILHSFHIVHMDIKPMNIMFSPSKKELVLIDFGFSNIIKEEIGIKTESSFAGTLNYCSPEMKAIYSVKSARSFVDLYFNDTYSL